MNLCFFWTVAAGMAATMVGFGQAPASVSGAKSEVSKKEVRPATKISTSPRGVRVFVDPETHKIRQPTQEEVRSLSEQSTGAAGAAKANVTGPQVLRGPEDAIGLELDESSMSYTVATKGSDGKVAVDCVTAKNAAAARVEGRKEASSVSVAKKGAADDR
jgi:hypothetical protein